MMEGNFPEISCSNPAAVPALRLIEAIRASMHGGKTTMTEIKAILEDPAALRLLGVSESEEDLCAVDDAKSIIDHWTGADKIRS